MSKGPEAFRTISEVAGDLALPQHVLRFWETRFSQIRPMKRGGGRRYYRPDDVELLRGIQHLLYGQGYTIRGVQRIFRDQGPRYVSAVGKGEAPVPAPPPEDSDEEHEAPAIARRGHGVVDHQVETDNDEMAADEHPRARARLRLPAALTGRSRAADGDVPATGGALSKEEVRRLQGTLFELLECKRLLDQAR